MSLRKHIGLVAIPALFLLALAAFVGLPLPPGVEAQAPERIAQQTFPYIFTWTPNGAIKTFAIPNLGQAAHSIGYSTSGVVPGQCVLLFLGSNDKVNWVTIDALVLGGISGIPYAIGNGQFQYFELEWNPAADSACSASVTITANYVGYQFPLPSVQAFNNGTIASVASPVHFLNTDAAPLIVGGLECTNPNAAVVYLDVFDVAGTASAPAYSTATYTFAIAASTSTEIPVHNMKLTNGLWLAAVTTLSGSTPVSSALTCQAQVNMHGPFF